MWPPYAPSSGEALDDWVVLFAVLIVIVVCFAVALLPVSD